MGWLDIYNAVGTLCSIIGLGVSFYSLWLVKGIDARVADFRAGQRYLEQQEQLKPVVSEIERIVEQLIRDSWDIFLTAEERAQLGAELELNLQRVFRLKHVSSKNKNMNDLIAQIEGVDVRREIINQKKSNKALYALKDLRDKVQQLSASLDKEIDQRLLGMQS